MILDEVDQMREWIGRDAEFIAESEHAINVEAENTRLGTLKVLADALAYVIRPHAFVDTGQSDELLYVAELE